MPEDYLARLKPEPAEGLGPLLKLEFGGQSVDAPLISIASRKFNIDISILSSQMDYAGGVKFGVMLAELDGNSPQDVEAAISFLKEHHVKQRFSVMSEGMILLLVKGIWETLVMTFASGFRDFNRPAGGGTAVYHPFWANCG